MEATNNDPGEYTIGFAPALRGKTITLGFDLPPLLGGGVTIEGAGVTLRPGFRGDTPCHRCGFHVASSGNRLQGLTLAGFGTGVVIGPYLKPGGVLPIRKRLDDNIVRGLVIRRAGEFGIVLLSVWSPTCGVPKPQPCRTFSTWSNTIVSGNTIDAGATGIAAKIANSGDRVVGLTVTDNSIRVRRSTDSGIGLNAGGDSIGARISGVLIARNTIRGAAGIGIDVASGPQRAQATVVEAVRVLDNRIQLSQRTGFCCQGIVVQAGSDTPEAIFPSVRPLRYPDGNVTRNVLVRENTIGGTIVWGVSVQAGIGAGGSRNTVRGVRIERNTISSSSRATGVFVWAGAAGSPPYRTRIATGNRVTGVTISANRISLGGSGGPPPPVPGGVAVLSGGQWGRGNTIACIRLSGNRISGAPATSVRAASGNRATLGC